MWRLSRFWIENPAVQEHIQEGVCHYWLANAESAIPEVTWDAFKAWARGAYVSRIAAARKAWAQSLIELEREVAQKEAAYVANPNPSAYGAWQFALQQLSLLRIDETQKSRLHLE